MESKRYGGKALLSMLGLCLALEAGPVYAQPAGDAGGDTAGQTVLPAAANQNEVNGSFDDVRVLLTDVAAAKGCGRLAGRIFSLSDEQGAWSGEEGAPDIGNLWIQECEIHKTAAKELELTVGGEGWRWLSRSNSKLGAEFKIDQMLKFRFTAKAHGTVDLAYNHDRHILTLWLVPLAPIDVEFALDRNVDVKEETLWSILMGRAAAWTGASPEERAEQTIQSTFIHKFQQKIAHGFTAVLDLCTGKRYLKFGTFEAGKIPEAPRPEGEKITPGKLGRLYPGGLLLAGPQKTTKPFTVELEHLEGGSFDARLLCRKDAAELASAYLGDKPLPSSRPLAEARVEPGKRAELRGDASAGCEAVLVFTPVEKSPPVLFSYGIVRDKEEKNTFVSCSNA